MMKFESRYNFGDRPYKINTTPEETFEPCSFCKGVGRIVGADKKRINCPECYGRGGKKRWLNKGWRISGRITVGEIRISHRQKSNGHDPDSIFSNYGPQDEERKEEYMCYETGIGSGSVHYVDTLWPTKKEAQAECNRRNAESEDMP